MVDSDSLSLYRKFLKAGAIRTLLSRVTSLFFIIVISRLVSTELYDIVVILSSIQLIFTIFATLGLKYSSIHYLRIEKGRGNEILALPIQLTVYYGLPLLIILWEAYLQISFKLNISGRLVVLQDDWFSQILFIISFSTVIIVEGLKNRLTADLKTDQVEKITTITSVLQSFSVPLFFYLMPTLSSFFLGWIVVTIIPIIMWRHVIWESLKQSINYPLAYKVIKFGFLIYLLAVLNIIATYFIKFVIFVELPEGNTAIYHWVLRFNELTFASLAVFTSGLFPLLLSHAENRKEELIIEDNKSFYRIALATSMATFGTLILSSRFILTIVLPTFFLSNIGIFYIIAIGTYVQTINSFLNAHLQAFAKRRWLLIITFLTSLLSIFTPVLLVNYGIVGIAYSLLVIYGIRLLFFAPIIKSMKFHTFLNVLYPTLFGIFILIGATIISSLSTNLYVNILIIIPYLIINYILLRVFKIIRTRELQILSRFVPVKYRAVASKILK